MHKKFVTYAQEVVSYLQCDQKTAEKIKDDLIEILTQKSEAYQSDDPYELMGQAKEVANEFAENLGLPMAQRRELKSSITVSGLPLYHVSLDPKIIARGFFSFGTVATGVFSFGAISVGVISLGAITAGVFSFGGLALALLAAFGGVAIGYDVAIGGLALSYHLAIGGAAFAKHVAIGGFASAELMGYLQDYARSTMTASHAQSFKFPLYKNEFKQAFEQLFPNFMGVKALMLKLFLG